MKTTVLRLLQTLHRDKTGADRIQVNIMANPADGIVIQQYRLVAALMKRGSAQMA